MYTYKQGKEHVLIRSRTCSASFLVCVVDPSPQYLTFMQGRTIEPRIQCNTGFDVVMIEFVKKST